MSDTAGVTVSMTTMRDVDEEILPLASVAKNAIVLVPWPSPERPSVQFPAPSAVVVALVALLEMVDDASAVPVKVSRVDVAIAPSCDGATMIGAAGGVMSAGALDADDDEFDDPELDPEDEDDPDDPEDEEELLSDEDDEDDDRGSEAAAVAALAAGAVFGSAACSTGGATGLFRGGGATDAILLPDAGVGVAGLGAGAFGGPSARSLRVTDDP